MDKKTAALSLYRTLKSQSALLDQILDAQQKIRIAVTDKQYSDLEGLLYKLGGLAETFCELEHTRIAACAGLSAEANEDGDVFIAVRSLSEANRNAVLEVFRDVRGKLSRSKIENEALNAFIKVAREFLQGVLDRAIPDRRNPVYSNRGSVVQSSPESLVLDAII